MDDDEIMRQINERGGGGGYNDIDDEMAALEAELASETKGKKTEDDELLELEKENEEEEKKPTKKIEKHESDDELKALENEGFDDLDYEEESKPKQQTIPQPQTQTKSQPPIVQNQQQPALNKQEIAKAMKSMEVKKSQTSGIDLYPEKVEKRYHDVDKMTSLGVLEKEKEICDKIVEYKKDKGEEYDTWEIKKESVEDKMGIVTSTIQDGLWDFEMYKKKIQEQYVWESKLLLFSDKDPSLKDEQKKILKERIKDRKKIIEEELKRNPEEEEEKEEKEEKAPKIKEEKKEPIKIPPQKSVPSDKPSQFVKVDDYPEKTEAKFHDVRKMDSLGVLEKEKEICDIIISYKKEIGEDYDSWEIKKDTIDTRKDTITASIENGIIDFEGYKKKIQIEYQWESKLLIFADKDPSLNEAQKKILKERINNRKKIIEEELTHNPDKEVEEEGQKEIPKEKVEEPRKKNEEFLPNKSLNPMFDVPKEKEIEEINRLTQVVNDRLNEYRAAIDYFQINQLSEQQVAAIKCADEINEEYKKIKYGKWKEVNEFKLPDPITPEFIYGCSKQERDAKFIKVINRYKIQKNEATNDINAILESLKKLNKVQLKKAQVLVKKDLDCLNEKREKIQKLINVLDQYKQDKWVPAPLFIETEEEKRIPKINKEIPEYTVRIQFGKTSYVKKDKIYLKVRIEDKNMEKTINQKAPGNWSEPFEFQFDKSSFKSFYNTKINVYIYEKKHIIKDKFKGTFEMQAKGLKDHIEYYGTFKINLESKRQGQTVDATFQVRSPCKEPEYIVEIKPNLQVKLIYKPFDIKGKKNTEAGIQYEVPQQNLTANDLKINNQLQVGQTKVPSKKPAPSQRTPINKPRTGGAPGKKPGPPKEAVDKSQFKNEELQDPDCIECLNTLQVLEFKINKYEEIRNKIDGRTPRELMQRIIKMKCKLQTLTNSLGDDISPNDYLVLLKSTFDHDKKLATYFSQVKDVEKSKLVSERLPLLIKETEELIKQMPK